MNLFQVIIYLLSAIISLQLSVCDVNQPCRCMCDIKETGDTRLSD